MSPTQIDREFYVILARAVDGDLFFPETMLSRATRAAIVEDLASGQYDYCTPTAIIYFNPAEGIARDVTEDIVRDVLAQIIEDGPAPDHPALGFIEDVLGMSAVRAAEGPVRPCSRCNTAIRPEGGHRCGDCGRDI